MADFDWVDFDDGRWADSEDGRWAGTTGDYLLWYYSVTAVLRRLCRSTEAAARPCRSFEEFDARFGRRDLGNWERLASIENDAIVALARAGRGQ